MREKVINLGRFGLRKHTEIAENTEISFSTTDYTDVHGLFFPETKTSKTLTLYVSGFSALYDARHLFFL